MSKKTKRCSSKYLMNSIEVISTSIIRLQKKEHFGSGLMHENAQTKNPFCSTHGLQFTHDQKGNTSSQYTLMYYLK